MENGGMENCRIKKHEEAYPKVDTTAVSCILATIFHFPYPHFLHSQGEKIPQETLTCNPAFLRVELTGVEIILLKCA